MLVLAGAGSGKTRVITEKIAYLIDDCNITPNRIAAVTFTNKAAQEMKSRVKKVLGRDKSRGLRVSTFHRLCLNILHKEYEALNYKAGFSVFAYADSISVLQELLRTSGDRGIEVIERTQRLISKWKNDGIMPEQAATVAEDDEQLQSAKLYVKYQRQLHAYNAFDLDDLILQTAQLFLNNPEILDAWQNKIHYLLVDEYQDTNAMQYLLVKMLSAKRNCLTVVGDDDQSVYAWRGAKPENIELLADDFANLKIIKLEQNYRSCGRILKVANALIKNNPHVYEKRLWSELGYGEEIRVIQNNSAEDEAERVCVELQSHKLQSSNRYGDYVILYRGNFQSREFEQYLRTLSIPYVVSGGISFFDRTEIKDLIAYLRLLVNPDDDAAFLRVINTPRRQIGPATLETLALYAQKRNVSLLQASTELALKEKLSAKAVKNLERFSDWLLQLADKAEDEKADKVLGQLLSDLGYETWLMDQSKDMETAERRWANVLELKEWIAKIQKKDSLETSEKSSIAEIISRITLMDIMQRDDEQSNDSVRLMTLHAAKGLEFKHVFLVGFEEDLLPHSNSILEDNIEEERRLAYVGITRAQQTLTITMARTRKRHGEKIICEPSRFLDELPKMSWNGLVLWVLIEQNQHQRRVARIYRI